MDAFAGVEDIMLVKNDTKLWIAIAVLGVALIIGFALFFTKRGREPMYGWLQIDKKFVNVGSVVTEGSNIFYLVLEAQPVNAWTKKLVSEKEFILSTELDGQVFSIAPFVPPDDLPSNLVWIGPSNGSAPGQVLNHQDCQAWKADADGVIWWSEFVSKTQVKLV